ncbi:UNVERIFIED_CONTAM: hypothetical protein GTU68_018463 [Idotea baltica]|nr:hypothetical protein [Idotea baltica]
MELAYEAHKVTLSDADVKSPEFLSLNPNNKIPAIIDPNGPDGPIGLFESGAILIYLAEKTGQLIGTTSAEKAKTIQWLMFQMGGLGPMLGQLGFFYKFAGSEWEDKRPQQRYIGEGKRLLGVLDKELSTRDWITGTYSIADIAIAPWLRALDFYGAKEAVEWDSYTHLHGYMDRFLSRDAVQKGLVTPPRE